MVEDNRSADGNNEVLNVTLLTGEMLVIEMISVTGSLNLS